MNERQFQAKLLDAIRDILPGCIILKNDSSYLQGIPDLSIFYGKKWAMLEVKKDQFEDYQPNQKYYLAKTNAMSYSATVYPENMEDILNELQQALRPGR